MCLQFGDRERGLEWIWYYLNKSKKKGVDALFLSKSISLVWNHETWCSYQGWKVFTRKHEPQKDVYILGAMMNLGGQCNFTQFPSPWKCCRPALPPPLAVEKGGETTDSPCSFPFLTLFPSNHGVEHWWDSAQTGWCDKIAMAQNWGLHFGKRWIQVIFKRQIFWIRFFRLYPFLPTQITI